MENSGRGQDGGGVGGHARPLPQTQQKKHIYRINDSHRTATNRWQRNLNSNNGKKFVTLLGRTGEKRRVREGESGLNWHSWKGTVKEKGNPHPGKSPDWRRNQPSRRDLQMPRKVQQYVWDVKSRVRATQTIWTTGTVTKNRDAWVGAGHWDLGSRG